MGHSTLVIGDIHGTFSELEELVRAVGYKKGGALDIVSVGDIVDRGPEPRRCVAFLMEIGAKSVLGNHEESHLQYLNSLIRKAKGEKVDIRQLNDEQSITGDQLTEKEINWIAGLPLWLKIRPNVVVVHAGLEAAYPLESQTENVLRLKQVLDTTGGKARYFKEPGKEYSVIEKGKDIPWMEAWLKNPNNPSVIYGHDNTHTANPRFDAHRWRSYEEMKKPDEAKVAYKPWVGPYTIGIDTGCVYGGHLTGFLVDEHEIVQVRAAKEYWSVGRSWPAYSAETSKLDGKGTGSYPAGPRAQSALKLTSRKITAKQDKKGLGVVPDSTFEDGQAGQVSERPIELWSSSGRPLREEEGRLPVIVPPTPIVAVSKGLRHPPLMPGEVRKTTIASTTTTALVIKPKVTDPPIERPTKPPALCTYSVKSSSYEAKLAAHLDPPKEETLLDYSGSWNAKDTFKDRSIKQGLELLKGNRGSSAWMH